MRVRPSDLWRCLGRASQTNLLFTINYPLSTYHPFTRPGIRFPLFAFSLFQRTSPILPHLFPAQVPGEHNRNFFGRPSRVATPSARSERSAGHRPGLTDGCSQHVETMLGAPIVAVGSLNPCPSVVKNALRSLRFKIRGG
jgi:hypothetical protein